MTPHRIRIALGSRRPSLIEVDGLDVSRLCTGVTLSAAAADLPTVTLELCAEQITVECDAKVEALIRSITEEDK